MLFIGSIALVNAFKTFTSMRSSKVRSFVGLTMKDYSIPDQPKRFANAKAENNERFLNIDKFFKPDYLKGKSVLVTGGVRGLGRAITDELIKSGANVIITSRTAAVIPGAAVIDGIEVNPCTQSFEVDV